VMSDYPFEWCKQHTTRSNTCKDCEIKYLFTEHIRLRVIEGAARAVLRNPLNIGLLQKALEGIE